MKLFLLKYFQGDIRSVTVKKNIAASFAIKGVSILISLMLVPATLGYVSADLYGVWLALASILQWVQFLDLGLTLGLKNKLTEAIANNDWRKAKSLVTTTYVMVSMIFVPVCIIFMFLAPLVDWCSLLKVGTKYAEDINHVIFALIAFVCIQMIVNVFNVVLAAFQRVAFSSLFSVIGQTLAFILILILPKLIPPSLLALAITYSALPVLVILCASIYFFITKYKRIAPSLSSFDKSLLKDLFSLGSKFFIINIQIVVIYQSTNILISYVSSPFQVTEYNIAYRYLNVAMLVYSLITAPLWPAYTDAFVKKDYIWMKNVYNKMLKILALSYGACIMMVILSPIAYHLWIEDKVDVSFTMTILVALYVMAYGWMNVNGTPIVGCGIIRINTIIAVIGMCVHIPIALLLGHYLNAYGVVVSMITINLFYGCVLYIQLKKIFNNTATGIWLK